jgi:hypothetical protein
MPVERTIPFLALYSQKLEVLESNYQVWLRKRSD